MMICKLKELWRVKMRLAAGLVVAVALGAAVAACSGGGDATPSPKGATPQASVSPLDTSVTPPLEGAKRLTVSTKRTNYRQTPEFELPSPGGLPRASGDSPIYNPPADPKCPSGWTDFPRPTEGFKICYPSNWLIRGHGYVSAGYDDRWYSVGFFLMKGDAAVAHVSVYVFDAYAQPVTYTKDCPQDYQVAFAGMPAVLCPDHPGGRPSEVKIETYQVRKNDLDYFVNVVPNFNYDAATEKYLTTWDKQGEATAVQIAQTFQFIPLQTPFPTPSPAHSQTPTPSP